MPEEVLVTVMRDHQKYFAIEGADGKLLPHFLAVLNTDGDAEGLIRHGNERVLRARFNDARFFWQTDQKQDLRARVELLKNVTFPERSRSYYEKTLRVQHLASWLSETIRQNGIAVRPGIVHKAALLAKADLTTELVKEFTELQGIVGGLYAKAQQLIWTCRRRLVWGLPRPSTIITNPSRWKMTFRERLRERCCRLRIRQIRLPGCSRWG